ncbi:hypothetical protein GN244_ATG02605 [Phytophthora infestans]|uniref:Uncharacterized protein n=1 Tax=Phytophthora infestans TaxID=4787 RepID=A0A833TRA5_PHYIN|nr:hypothetical protein GN244_ATG02605 [Phytophthora infestans]KAF4141674.1 hypothetical protein GN958_ATG09121 [Phytophthora infestans]
MSSLALSADEYEVKSSEVIGNTSPPISGSPPAAEPHISSSIGASSALALATAASTACLHDGSEASSVAHTRSFPGMVIVSTFSPGFDPCHTFLSPTIPVPTHGVQPVGRFSAKIPAS